MEECCISLEGVSKSFKNKKVLNSISFTCPHGLIVGFTGYNGSGKSVLFKCICGIYNVDSGKISFNGIEQNRSNNKMCDAGVIIEHPGFLGNTTGYKNLLYLYSINNKPDKDHIYSVMKQVGLDPALKTKVRNYSLGMKQRLGIAQAIMEDKSLLILDEPMNGLDRQGVEEMRELFLKLKEQGKTILMASHNKDDIDSLCDHVYELDNGKLIKVR